MSLSPKTWRIIACIAILIAGLTILINIDGAIDNIWQAFKPEIIQENADLTVENEQLKDEITGLQQQNTNLRTI